MNREDLIKKLELARVGSGTQTYNDVVLTLTKEETLELFKYIEQLEKENQGVKDDNTRLWHGLEYGNNEISKLKQAIKILKDKIEFEDLGEMQSGNMYRGYFNDCLDEEEVNSLKQVFESVGEE